MDGSAPAAIDASTVPGGSSARRPSRRRRWLLLLAGALLVATAAHYLVPFIRRIPAAAPVLAVAHRGGPATSGAPEGTLAAFEAAADAGADWLELDVRATSDGVPVVLHDETVDRTTDGTGRVSELTLEQVRALDAGGGARVPTVDEVVSLAGAAGLPILAEVKDGPAHPSVAGDLIGLLRDRGYLDRTVIAAFETDTLSRVRALAPEAATCRLSGPGEFAIASPPAGARYVCPMGEMLLLYPDMIRQAHEAGLTVLAWWGVAETGVTDAILEAYGADGLIVDDLRPLTGD